MKSLQLLISSCHLLLSHSCGSSTSAVGKRAQLWLCKNLGFGFRLFFRKPGLGGVEWLAVVLVFHQTGSCSWPTEQPQ